MNTSMHGFTAAFVAATAFALATAAPAAWADGKGRVETEVSQGEKHPQENVVKLKDARLKIELNATAGDAGIQVFIDADPWKSMDIYDPFGRLVFRSTTYGRFAKQGGTELFLESAEPNFSELTLAEFLKRFPQGQYQFRGKGTKGETFVGTATLTHNLPAGPQLVWPVEGAGLVDANNATLMWKSVDAPNGSPIVGYQVLIVQIQSSFPAIPKVALDVTMPASATSMAVPPGFLLPGTQYEWEVLAIEAGGNQTLSTSFFQTAP